VSARAVARDTAAELAAAGVAEAAFEAEYLVRAISGLSRAAFYADAPWPAGANGELAAALERRMGREPAAYIAGVREFFGREFTVDRGVLIPRPETELLVELALAEIAPGSAPVAADVGTGSGCIGVSVALERPSARVVAVDVSAGACSVAAGNAGRLRAGVTVVRGDLLAPLRQADIVLANLPYIASKEIAELQPEVRDWEPRLALDGGPDGLDLIRRLVADCGERVRPRLLALEVAAGQARDVAALASAAGATAAVHQDLAGIERVVTARWV
jgi:release factor glutamine methyltransferase